MVTIYSNRFFHYINFFCTVRQMFLMIFFFFSSRRRHTRFDCDWSSDVCSSDLVTDRGPDEHARSRPVEAQARGGIQAPAGNAQVAIEIHHLGVEAVFEPAQSGIPVDRKSVV